MVLKFLNFVCSRVNFLVPGFVSAGAFCKIDPLVVAPLSFVAAQVAGRDDNCCNRVIDRVIP